MTGAGLSVPSQASHALQQELPAIPAAKLHENLKACCFETAIFKREQLWQAKQHCATQYNNFAQLPYFATQYGKHLYNTAQQSTDGTGHHGMAAAHSLVVLSTASLQAYQSPANTRPIARHDCSPPLQGAATVLRNLTKLRGTLRSVKG